MATSDTTADDDSIDDATDDRPSTMDWDTKFAQGLELWDEADEGSHTELHPDVFHASQVGFCKRQLLAAKLGISDLSEIRGILYQGESIHEFVEDWVPTGTHFSHEQPVEFVEDGITFVGTYDGFDEHNGIVYDFKSRGSWYSFDPPKPAHVDQLHVYQRALDADYGQVVYVHRAKMETRAWPEAAPFTFDDDRWAEIKQRCQDVRDFLYENGLPRDESELPDKCSRDDGDPCFHCQSETLDFSSFNA